MKKTFNRRMFLTKATLIGGLPLLMPQIFPPVARAATPDRLALLSDLGGVLPPTQVITACTGPGVLNVTWAPGSIPGGAIRCNIYVDGVLVNTSYSVNSVVSNLSTTAPHLVEVATLSADKIESEKSAGIERLAAATDNDSDLRPPYLIGIRAFGGAQLRWVHPGPQRNLVPAQYAVYSADSPVALAILPGSTTSYFATDLTPGTTYEFIVATMDANGMRGNDARNTVRITPYTRQLYLDYSPPSIPAGLTVVGNNGALTIQWSPSTDSSSGVQGYKIFVAAMFSVAIEVGTSAVIPNLVNGRSYGITVSA